MYAEGSPFQGTPLSYSSPPPSPAIVPYSLASPDGPLLPKSEDVHSTHPHPTNRIPTVPVKHRLDGHDVPLNPLAEQHKLLKEMAELRALLTFQKAKVEEDEEETAAPDYKKYLLRDCLVELLCTMLFVFVGVGSAVIGRVGAAGGLEVYHVAAAFGLAIAVLASAFGRFSGAHINPAVTLGALAAGRLSVLRLLYIPCQMIGAALGVLLVKLAVAGLDHKAFPGIPSMAANMVAKQFNSGQAFIVEFVLTYLLVAVVMFLTSAANAPNEATAPLYIGLAVWIAHIVAIPVTGCSINPARSFGSSVVSGTWDDHWVFWCAPLLGGLVAGLSIRIGNKISAFS